jgi:hypothetical protein
MVSTMVGAYKRTRLDKKSWLTEKSASSADARIVSVSQDKN